MRNLIQLKANVTIKQKNTQRYSAMVVVPLPSSVCSLQISLLVVGERQEHSAGRAREGRKARLDVNLHSG